MEGENRMKTQLSITVKGDWLMKYTSFWTIFPSRKPYIGLYIDKAPGEGGELIKLKMSKAPYVIEIEPGEHQFYFVDSNVKNKKILSGSIKFAMGMAFGAFTGSLNNAVLATSRAMDISASKKEIRDNYMHLTMQEGDLFKISVKPGKKGIVKIQELN